MSLPQRAIQDYYPDRVSHCYGCGRLNKHGLHLKSYWVDDEAICNFEPEPYHLSFPGAVYGGLIAAVIECHSMATAVAATYDAEGRQVDSEPLLGFLVASMHVDYVKRTPISLVLELRASVTEWDRRKVRVRCDLLAKEELCARAEVLVVRVSEAKMLGTA